jgi:hypothetical protein
MEGSNVWWPLKGSKLGGQRKVPNLVVNERFQAWWPLEGEGEGETCFLLKTI